MIGKNFKADPGADPFGEITPAARRERYSVLGGRVTVVSDHEPLLRLARTAFGELPARRSARPTPSLEVFLRLTRDSADRWRKEPPPMRYFAGGGLWGGAMDSANIAVIDPARRQALVCISPRLLRSHYHARCELLEFAVYTLATQALRLAPLHAACLGLGRRGVLIAGASGTGKSTLAMHWALQELDFLSEDSTLVEPRTLAATGLASYVHVREDSLRFVEPRALRRRIRQTPVIHRRSGVAKHELDLREFGSRLARSPLVLDALVFLSSRTARSAALLHRLDPVKAVDRLRREQPYAARQATWPLLARNLGHIPAYELWRGTHPSESVAAIRGLLGS